jgi:hypothetical protein
MAQPTLNATILVALGLLAGIGVAVLALGMSGGGHGWNSAFISSVSVVGSPLAALAWSLRHRRAGIALAAVLLIVAVGFDILLWSETKSEGSHYAAQVWNAGAGLVMLWGALFACWQLLAATTILVGMRERVAD